jgi:uncharacterized protein YcaQ
MYKPVHPRCRGYYTLPILYEDDPVARLDPKLDRTTMTVQIRGFGYEDDAPVTDPTFGRAPALGLIHFARLWRQGRSIIAVTCTPVLRKEVKGVIKRSLELVV